MEGKKIVITGANSGIGLEMTRILAQTNRVMAVDLKVDKFGGMENVIPLECDVSSKEGVDLIFREALEVLGGIDIFCANAGFAYFEEMTVEWDKTERIFSTNVFSPICSYQKFKEYLNNDDGTFAVTCSAMGEMAMPGFSLYSATKFAIDGFQEAVRFENPPNLKVVACYPVAVDTAFFDKFPGVEKPYPLQTPEYVASKFVKGISKGKKKVYTSKLYRFSSALFTVLPFLRRMYWNSERKKFERYVGKASRK